MYRLQLKLTVLLLLFTFSFTWISEQFLILTNEKKYDFYELAEKNTAEKNNESKIKLLFIDKIEFFNCFENYSFGKNRINSSDLFKAKESILKNTTPPPKKLV
jgi:hypothetical protein